MESHREADVRVDGPDVDRESGRHRYVAHAAERDYSFAVVPERGDEDTEGWGVEIEGLPAPGIVHDRPWTSVEAARDAAIEAIRNIVILEQVRRDEVPLEQEVEEPDERPLA